MADPTPAVTLPNTEPHSIDGDERAGSSEAAIAGSLHQITPVAGGPPEPPPTLLDEELLSITGDENATRGVDSSLDGEYGYSSRGGNSSLDGDSGPDPSTQALASMVSAFLAKLEPWRGIMPGALLNDMDDLQEEAETNPRPNEPSKA